MLARGGMAVVYLVRQPALDRDVVLKRLDLESDDPALAQRFVREARLAATLDHPTSSRCSTSSSTTACPTSRWSTSPAGRCGSSWAGSSCRSCAAWSRACSPGSGTRSARASRTATSSRRTSCSRSRGNVKIADFGIARAYNALTQRLTAPGMAIGTPAYMAPEQATNDPLGPYTDLYALGVIAYELLAGRPPFRADTPSDSSTRMCTEPAAARGARRPCPRRRVRLGGVAAREGTGRPRPSRRRRHGMRSRRSPSRRWGPTGGARPRSPHRCAAMRRHRRRRASRRRRRRAAQRRTRGDAQAADPDATRARGPSVAPVAGAGARRGWRPPRCSRARRRGGVRGARGPQAAAACEGGRRAAARGARPRTTSTATAARSS